MSDETAEIEALAERIRRGEDDYVLPVELFEEAQPGKPVNRSLYAQILKMTLGERIKLALKGNRDARMILLRDGNRLVPQFVLQNPRITDEEIIMVAKNRNLESELLRQIGEHKIWSRNYQVRLALVTNPKTPLATALHYVGTLLERDLRFLAKSKNVSANIVTHVRRLLFKRERR